jgi:hypoxanthine-DNA glycosylase
MAGRVPPAERRRGLPPIVAADARILILGSFPSEASLRARAYYAHPRNQFWPIIGVIVGEALAGMAYAERVARVRAHRIAIWDTIVECARAGSLDAAIRDAVRAEVATIATRARGLRVVAFNGRTSARAAPLWRAAGYETLEMPSTSPAYTLAFAEKLASWRRLVPHLENA